MARSVFRCELCLRVVPPRVSAQRVVLESREKTYPLRVRANRIKRRPPNGKRLVFYTNDPGGAGHETMREVLVCPACAAARG